MKNVSLNILGTCVVRDVFGLKEDDAGYEIRQFLNFVHPLTMFDSGVSIDLDKLFGLEVGKICRRWDLKCAYLDMTRGVYDYIGQRDSDYLIIDAALMRFDLVMFAGGELCCRSNNKLFKLMDKKRICPRIKKIVSIYSVPKEEMLRRIKLYAEKLLALYPADKIILTEVLNVDLYHNPNSGGLYRFERLRKYHAQNELISWCFDVLHEKLEGCHVIRMPENVVGDEFHKWGCCPMHYTMEYYDYCLKAVDLITKRTDGEDVKENLEILRREYSEIYLRKFGDNHENMRIFNEKLKKRSLADKLRQSWYRLMTHMLSGKRKHLFVAKRKEWWRV